MKRRQFLQTVGAAALGAVASRAMPLSADPPRPKRKPNLLFVFDDQHSHDVLGCYGDAQVISPNLDRLAKQGARFNYCISSDPVCTPTRGTLLTGQHPLYNGAFTNDVRLLTNNGPSIAEVLRREGYRTGYIGKWHLYGGFRYRGVPKGPDRHGFDVFWTNNCQTDFRPEKAFYFDESGRPVRFDKWETDGQADQAVEFLDGCEADKPFALFVSWHAPHNHISGRQYTAPKELEALYSPPRKINLRPNVLVDTAEVRGWYQGHLALITGIDKAFGRLMDKLDQKGLADNTLVVFTSDHGDNLNSNARVPMKSVPEDTACRVPLLMRFPGVLKANQVRDLLVGTLNLMPTVLGLMGMDVPPTCQGRNLAGDIQAGRDDAVESVPLYYFDPGWRGVFTRRYTYAFDAGKEKRSISFNVLYDRQNDPHQMNNLFYDPAHHALRAAMHAKALAWMDTFKDQMWSGPQIIEACGLTRPFDAEGRDSVLPGRPIDLLLNSGVKGDRDLPLPTGEEERTQAELAAARRAKWIETQKNPPPPAAQPKD